MAWMVGDPELTIWEGQLSRPSSALCRRVPLDIRVYSVSPGNRHIGVRPPVTGLRRQAGFAPHSCRDSDTANGLETIAAIYTDFASDYHNFDDSDLSGGSPSSLSIHSYRSECAGTPFAIL